jgi:HPt (histidine-containing phosphotransfer) domain-containing protein
VIDELQATFLPRFIELARSRVRRAIDNAGGGDPAATAATLRELHALVGEAGLLGLTSIIPLARDSEEKAKRLITSCSPQDATVLVAALEELGKVIELTGLPTSKESSHV